MARLRVFLLAFLLLASPFIVQVVRCQSESEPTEDGEGGEIGLVDEDAEESGGIQFGPAPGVDSVCVFPNDGARLVTAGEETQLLVGLKNDGEANLNVLGIRASVHLPYDHKLLVQNLTGQGFSNATVPASTQASFPYIFAVSKYLQPGNFDLVGSIFYEVDQQTYQTVFYNGTIEVVESGGLLNMESVFLVTLGIALLVLLGLWIQSRLQNLSKKTKKSPTVEVGTKTIDALQDEWLQGTAYTQSLSSKLKKKK